ncbi:MAG: hypothetical protein E7773_10105 [Sphingomonas sp.]|uniref:hypothetical protein n=1 Tax=Sphingomonas sp. TaxID=28214 RepID=UPI00120C4471|nr:hypothetical protein [Sphingomonas sp.]THD35690.1 MAG: hypothetical protein E7773_10105 [Sphingomonas sp.]
MSEFRQCPSYPEFRVTREGLVERERVLATTGEIKITRFKPGMGFFTFKSKSLLLSELMRDAWGMKLPPPRVRMADEFCPAIGRIVTIHERIAELHSNNENPVQP